MFILQEQGINPNALKSAYQNFSNGALVSFEGMVRSDEHKPSPVNALLYIADKPACLSEGEKILIEAYALFKITKVSCVQRIGKVAAGETAIWIGVWSPHRDEAFKACRYIIEEIKKRLLIWKKEFYEDGSSQWIQGTHTPIVV